MSNFNIHPLTNGKVLKLRTFNKTEDNLSKGCKEHNYSRLLHIQTCDVLPQWSSKQVLAAGYL